MHLGTEFLRNSKIIHVTKRATLTSKRSCSRLQTVCDIFQHRAAKTEAYLVGKRLSDASVVSGAWVLFSFWTFLPLPVYSSLRSLFAMWLHIWNNVGQPQGLKKAIKRPHVFLIKKVITCRQNTIYIFSQIWNLLWLVCQVYK